MGKIFTPNVELGNSDFRYRLYKHNDGTFSRTPRSKRFKAHYQSDTCGLDCECAAFIEPIDEIGKIELEKAEIF